MLKYVFVTVFLVAALLSPLVFTGCEQAAADPALPYEVIDDVVLMDTGEVVPVEFFSFATGAPMAAPDDHCPYCGTMPTVPAGPYECEDDTETPEPLCVAICVIQYNADIASDYGSFCTRWQAAGVAKNAAYDAASAAYIECIIPCDLLTGKLHDECIDDCLRDRRDARDAADVVQAAAEAAIAWDALVARNTRLAQFESCVQDCCEPPAPRRREMRSR